MVRCSSYEVFGSRGQWVINFIIQNIYISGLFVVLWSVSYHIIVCIRFVALSLTRPLPPYSLYSNIHLLLLGGACSLNCSLGESKKQVLSICIIISHLLQLMKISFCPCFVVNWLQMLQFTLVEDSHQQNNHGQFATRWRCFSAALSPHPAPFLS